MIEHVHTCVVLGSLQEIVCGYAIEVCEFYERIQVGAVNTLFIIGYGCYGYIQIVGKLLLQNAPFFTQFSQKFTLISDIE